MAPICGRSETYVIRIVLTIVLAFAVGCGSDIKKTGKVNPNSSSNSENGQTNGAVNSTSANVMSANCGDGTLDAAETCDPGIESGAGACPDTCASPACAVASLIGTASACTAECVVEPVGCVDGDGCCTAGCTEETDTDCTGEGPVCGNGTIEPGELCDGECPTSCTAGPSACQPNVLRGSASQCTSQCVMTTITSCTDGDGCCPAGCNSSNDSDCSANCTPDTCADLGATCGNPADGCGGTLQCGNCTSGSCTDDFVCISIGSPCEVDTDCVAGDLTVECSEEPGGYCTAICDDTLAQDPCPGDAFCSARGYCNGRCVSNTDCRPEYECTELTAGDPDSRTCLPVP